MRQSLEAMQQSMAKTQESVAAMSKRDTLLVQLEKQRMEGLSFRVAELEAHVSGMVAARSDMRGMFNTLASAAHLVNPGPQMYAADDTTSISTRSTSAVPPTPPPPPPPPVGGSFVRRNPPNPGVLSLLTTASERLRSMHEGEHVRAPSAAAIVAAASPMSVDDDSESPMSSTTKSIIWFKKVFANPPNWN